MTKKEPIADFLRRRLAEAVGMHNQIARETGVPQSSINRLHVDHTISPRLTTVQPLLDWFAAEDAKSARRAHRAVRTGNVKRGAAKRSAPGALSH